MFMIIKIIIGNENFQDGLVIDEGFHTLIMI